ncbi:Hpt domain-containing protein [Arthrobacter sp. ISL-65]|uniref:Hpt domain-containing protein n=1 Tax=Arthrobacter sp. ISL-65 TaxID=2819112 RepID=UPI001BE6C940|nr:Hpt domain-containing protein [Arthrobacter sp. ISL-65]MBT2549664.1 Hpt domain-containing protein [Arthrobacter sp. ISL-65]
MSEELFAVLDPNPLLCLVEDAGAEVAEGFFRTYLQMLPVRTAKLTRALLGGNQEAALDAVLSLKSTSRMAGAVRLARLCAELEGKVRAGSVVCRSAESSLLEQQRLIMEYAGAQVRVPVATP